MLGSIMRNPERYRNTLHYYRKTRRLTHQEMAEFIGCHRLRYRRIEQGHHTPNDDEWMNFISGSRFPQAQKQLAFPDFAQAQFLLPPIMRGQAFVSSRVGNAFQQLLLQHTDEHQWSQLIKILKIPAVYFNNSLNPYPYTLWLRLIEKCRIIGILKEQSEINTFAHFVVNSKQWWGSKWLAYQNITPDQRFDICLEEWKNRSHNHDIFIEKISKESPSLQIKVMPKPTVPQELYFNHPIIQDFLAQWICALLKSLSHGPHYLTYEKEKQSWLITAIRG
jgi:DNA-binding XRE family transcriptional regulator